MPQLETIFEKKALFKHSLGSGAVGASTPTPTTFEVSTTLTAAAAQPSNSVS